MKLLLPLLFIGSICFAQAKNQIKFPEKDGKVFYEVIDSNLNKTEPQIYDIARQWCANVFNDAKKVLQMDDKQTGEIIGKGVDSCHVDPSILDVDPPCLQAIRERA